MDSGCRKAEEVDHKQVDDRHWGRGTAVVCWSMRAPGDRTVLAEDVDKRCIQVVHKQVRECERSSHILEVGSPEGGRESQVGWGMVGQLVGRMVIDRRTLQYIMNG